MKTLRNRLPKSIRSALEATGRPFRVESHGKGIKLFLEQKQVGRLGNNGELDRGRAEKNILAQIKRTARGNVLADG